MRVYLDYAAATPLDPRVKEAMEPYWSAIAANASALYREGRAAKQALDESRRTVANILHCRPQEIVFTSGATEADNIAIFGAARRFPGRHLVASAIEHHSVLRSFESLERAGWPVSIIPVDETGAVDLAALRNAIRPDTVLISVMYANNEIGTIQPISEIAKIIRETKNGRTRSGNTLPLLFHSDASQAAGFLDLSVERLGVDLMTMNGAKIYGPKGAGALFVRAGTMLEPFSHGGGQEMGLRAGTENLPGIVGFAKALEIADHERAAESGRLAGLRDYLIGRLTAEIPKTILNGDDARRLPNNVNVSILDIEGEALVLYLDAKGIAASTGSACTSASLEPSHVILALGRPYEHAHGSLRLTLGRRTTKADLDYVMDVLPGIVEKLRAMSPVRMEPGQRRISHPEAFAGQNAKVKVGGRTYR